MTMGPEMTPPGLGHLRTSHSDRERAVDVLKAAFAEGRLDQDEYTERVGQAHQARTFADLAALTADLPVGPLGTLFPGQPYAGQPYAGAMLPAVPAAMAAPPAATPGRPVSQLAILSLFFGLATFLFPVLPVTLFPAIILGVAALARISTAGQRGAGLAAAGIGLALLGALGPTFGIFFLR
jgi:type IV secretory pathway VirB6-like protein